MSTNSQGQQRSAKSSNGICRQFSFMGQHPQTCRGWIHIAGHRGLCGSYSNWTAVFVSQLDCHGRFWRARVNRPTTWQLEGSTTWGAPYVARGFSSQPGRTRRTRATWLVSPHRGHLSSWRTSRNQAMHEEEEHWGQPDTPIRRVGAICIFRCLVESAGQIHHQNRTCVICNVFTRYALMQQRKAC